MRVLVFGAGAIGSVLGGFLAEAGHDVTLLGRAWHLDVVRRDGLRVSGLWGEHRIRLAAIATAVEQTPPGPYDWVFICVKAHQTAAAALELPRLLGPSTNVCAFQNGLGNYETLSAHIPRERIALGRVIFGVELTPGHARVTVCADDVVIGAPPGGAGEPVVRRLVEALRTSGIPCRAAPDILTVLWSKVLYNCALNGLATLFDVPYGRLPELPGARRLMEAVVREAYQAAAAGGIRLEPSTATACLEWLFTRLIPDTAAHRPSMLRDIDAGKPTEIDALNGAVVRLADAHGIPAAANALVTRLVHAKEQFVRAGR